MFSEHKKSIDFLRKNTILQKYIYPYLPTNYLDFRFLTINLCVRQDRCDMSAI